MGRSVIEAARKDLAVRHTNANPFTNAKAFGRRASLDRALRPSRSVEEKALERGDQMEMAAALGVRAAFPSVPLSLAWRALVWKVGPRKAYPIHRLIVGTSVCLTWGCNVDTRPVILDKSLGQATPRFGPIL